MTTHKAIRPEDDPVGAFFLEETVARAPTGHGLLDGLSCGVKDIFDIRGSRTGFGNPTWRATHAPAETDAASVAAVRAQGAFIVGKTHTDELAFSLSGDNFHYGAPVNTAAPDRYCGGSSSGSAAAVAAGLCDFALGTDTGGSVRAPASFCGLFGMRSSHDAISRDGVCALAPSFDTVGWFAGNLGTLCRVGDVLLPPDHAESSTDGIGWLGAAWNLIGSGDLHNVRARGQALAQGLGRLVEMDLDAQRMDVWFEAFRTLQFAEVAQALGPWMEEARPTLGPGVAERLAATGAVGATAREAAEGVRQEVRVFLRRAFTQVRVLVLPTVPGAAPLRTTGLGAMENYRRTAMRLLCIAGLGACPQVSLPLLSADGAPLGLSLLGAPGSDRQLLADAQLLVSGGYSGYKGG